MKYFRTLSWWMQLLWFLLVAITMLFFISTMVGILLPKFTGIDIVRLTNIGMDTPAYLVRTALVLQGVLNAFAFMVPALLFAYFTHPRPLDYLGLRKPGKNIQILLVILVMLGASPLLMLIDGLISHINFGAGVKAQQAAMEGTMNAFLNISSFGGFMRAFVILAVVPALGEELFFRGILLRLTRKKAKSMTFPVIFTSVVFAAWHSNVTGFVSIFFAGVLLAAIYNLTGSLWCNILGHFFFNGFQVTLAYMGNNNRAVKAFVDSNNVPVFLVIGGAIVFCISFYLLLRNKTPLPHNWMDDYTPEELASTEPQA
jgi:uncharacterized protein